MIGLGDTQRGGNSRGQIAPPAKAQEEQPSSRGCRLEKEGLWQSDNDPVGHFEKQDLERRFKHALIV